MEQICEKCKQNVSEDFEFCPYCGYAITLGAKQLTQQKFDIVKLKVLNDLADKIDHTPTLKILKEYANKINN